MCVGPHAIFSASNLLFHLFDFEHISFTIRQETLREPGNILYICCRSGALSQLLVWSALRDRGQDQEMYNPHFFFSFTFSPPSFGVNNNFSYNKEYYTPDTDLET